MDWVGVEMRLNTFDVGLMGGTHVALKAVLSRLNDEIKVALIMLNTTPVLRVLVRCDLRLSMWNLVISIVSVLHTLRERTNALLIDLVVIIEYSSTVNNVHQLFKEASLKASVVWCLALWRTKKLQDYLSNPGVLSCPGLEIGSAGCKLWGIACWICLTIPRCRNASCGLEILPIVWRL